MVKLATPRSPQEIGPEWLTDALRAGGVIKSANVIKVEPTIIGAGAGFLGQLAKLAVTYDRAEAGAPASIIAKLPTLDPGGRQVANMLRFYEREVMFYRELSPAISLPVPKLYYSAMDVEGDEYLLLLQDLAPAKEGDEATGVSVEDAELAIRSLAQFQADWWQSPRLAQMAWMPYVNDPVNCAAQDSYQQAWGPFCQLFGDALSPRMMALGEEMQQKVIALLNAVAPEPRTILHGDFRGDNVFYGDGKTAPRFSVIDWQITNKGRGVFDVAYFLATSVTPEVRREHEMRLIRLWHDIISDKNDTKDYPYEAAVHDYRVSSLFMHVYTVVALGTLDMANERGVMLFNEWLRRRVAAIDELDCYELMPP